MMRCLAALNTLFPATALEHGLCLVKRNVRMSRGAGRSVLSVGRRVSGSQPNVCITLAIVPL